MGIFVFDLTLKAKHGMKELINSKKFNKSCSTNPLAGPIRFELHPQGTELHILNSKTKTEGLDF